MLYQYSILLVEDEEKLCNLIKDELQTNGYKVETASDGIKAEQLFYSHKFSLVILDLSLPGKNGFELCKTFRASNKKIPIVILTAFGEIQNKVDAFDFGADDYIVKPFHFEELIARIKTLLKKTEISKLKDNDIIIIEDLEINNNSKRVFRANIEISLTAKEFLLLKLLAENKGRITSKQEILEKVWELSFDTGTNTIEVYISFLRNKVDKPFERKLIYTKSNFGYYIK